MEKFMNWMGDVAAPKMEELTGNAWLSAMQKAIIKTLPMVLVGSLITIYNVLRNFIPALPVLTALRDYTFGLISLFMVFLIPYYVLELKKNNKMKLIAGFTGVALFMILVNPEITDGGYVYQFSAFGAGGMFVAITANADALAAGLSASQPFTNEAVYAWLSLGGRGATLPLSVMLLFAASKQLKALGKASIVPSLLNINEPVVFGCVAWNPLLMIPMWITAIVLPVITCLAQVTGLVAIPVEVFNMWYCPVFISSWLVNHSLSGLVLTVINLAVATAIFFPFFKIYDRQQLKLEQEEAE